MPVVVCGWGWSGQGGFELFLMDSTKGEQLWDLLWETGLPFGLGVGAPNNSERIESFLLSFGGDTDPETDPDEAGIGRFVSLSGDDDGPEASTSHDFIGKAALRKIKTAGVKQKLAGLKMGGSPITWYNEDFYLVKDSDSGDDVGYVTSAFWSPAQGSNIALAVMPRSHWKRGTQVKVQLPADGIVDAAVVRVPFVDPTKDLPKTELLNGSSR